MYRHTYITTYTHEITISDDFYSFELKSRQKSLDCVTRLKHFYLLHRSIQLGFALLSFSFSLSFFSFLPFCFSCRHFFSLSSGTIFSRLISDCLRFKSKLSESFSASVKFINRNIFFISLPNEKAY